MLRVTDLKLPLDHDEAALEAALRARLGLPGDAPLRWEVARRGYDARRRSAISLIYSLDVALADEAALLRRHADNPTLRPRPDTAYRPVGHAPPALPDAPADRSPAGCPPMGRFPMGHSSTGHSPTGRSSLPHAPVERPVVVGTGPCGLFAALVLAQSGFRPIVLERGRMVRQRTRDTWALWRRGVLDPRSNVQFGEGGAGTFSDGKLWSGIKDPLHLGRKVLTELVAAGAPPEILTASKPHIGTFRLVQVVEAMRATIETLGGEYRFGTTVTGLDIEDGRDGRALRGLVLEDGTHLPAHHVVLAIGHSARDSFAALAAAGVALEAKPFSIGVRIEHPQSLIDRARFGPSAGHPRLGAADYKLVHHATGGRSVYSFCMCPGGTVVAATSEPGRVVTNGMSQYSRAERNANAGLVVGITPADYPGGPLAGIAFQRHWEERAFVAGGGTYAAPAQRVGDFLAGRPSTALGTVEPSYKPGVTPTDLALCLPDFAVAAIREALPAFDRQVPGFAMADAVMTGVETRTSSPLRIGRGTDGQSLNTRGLFPAGEGAGYAGGILSAGVDGIRAAEAVTRALLETLPRTRQEAPPFPRQ